MKNTTRAVMEDIARQAGVSVSTVARVLAGRPDVAEHTRKKVLHYAQELEYAGKLQGGGNKIFPPHQIGVVVPKITYVADILEGIAECLKEYNASPIIYVTNDSHEQELELLERLPGKSERGHLIILPKATDEKLRPLSMKQIPFVLIDPLTRLSSDIPVVTDANVAGAQVATRHLLSLGHRRIGIISGPFDGPASLDRFTGYRTEMLAAGVAHDDELVEVADYTLSGGYEAAKRLFQRERRPTAIFAFNDVMAAGVLQAAREAHISIPQDLSVMGFGENGVGSIRYSLIVSPQLTTIMTSAEDLGRLGVDLLYRMLSGRPLKATRIEVAANIVVRESTGPVHS